MFLLPKNHRFAKRKALLLAEMDGENMLLFSKIGFWYDLVTKKMPNSHFLVQTERYTFDELILNSMLPCFVTDLASKNKPLPKNRVPIPISDMEVNITYYLVCKKSNQKRFTALFKN